jgi:hypothetical protein
MAPCAERICKASCAERICKASCAERICKTSCACRPGRRRALGYGIESIWQRAKPVDTGEER